MADEPSKDLKWHHDRADYSVGAPDVVDNYARGHGVYHVHALNHSKSYSVTYRQLPVALGGKGERVGPAQVLGDFPSQGEAVRAAHNHHVAQHYGLSLKDVGQVKGAFGHNPEKFHGQHPDMVRSQVQRARDHYDRLGKSLKKAVFHHENWKPGEEHGPSQKLDWKSVTWHPAGKEASTPHGFYRHFPAEARMPSATVFHPRIKDPGRPDAEYYGGSDHPGYQEWRGTDDRTKAHAEHHNLVRHHGMSEADVDHVTRAYPDRKLEDFHGKHPAMVQAEIKRARDHFEKSLTSQKTHVRRHYAIQPEGIEAFGVGKTRRAWKKRQTAAPKRREVEGHHFTKAKVDEKLSNREKVQARESRANQEVLQDAGLTRRDVKSNWRGRGNEFSALSGRRYSLETLYGADELIPTRFRDRPLHTKITGPKPGQLPKGKVSGTYPEEPSDRPLGKTLRKMAVNEQEILSNPNVKRFVKLLGEKIFEASRPKLKIGDRIIHRFLGLGKVHSVLDPEHDDPQRGASFLIDFLDFTMACFQDEITPMEVPALQDRPLPIKANAQSVIPTAPPHPAIELTEGMRPHMGAVVEQQQAQEQAQLEAMQDGQGEGEDDGGSEANGPFDKSSAEIVREALLKSDAKIAHPVEFNGPWTPAQTGSSTAYRNSKPNTVGHGEYYIWGDKPYRVKHYARDKRGSISENSYTFLGEHSTLESARKAVDNHHAVAHHGLKQHEVAAVHAAWPDEGPSRFLGKHPDHVKAEVRRALQAHNPDHPDLQKAKIDDVRFGETGKRGRDTGEYEAKAKRLERWGRRYAAEDPLGTNNTYYGEPSVEYRHHPPQQHVIQRIQREGPKPGQLPKGKVSGTYPEEADIEKAKVDYVNRDHPPKGYVYTDEQRGTADRITESRRNRRRINWENHWDELQTGHGGQSGGRDRPRTRFQPNPELPGGRTIEDVGREGTPADELVEKGRVKRENKTRRSRWEAARAEKLTGDPHSTKITARHDRNVPSQPQNRPPSGNPRRRFVGDYSDRNFPLTEPGGLTQVEGRNEARTRLRFTRRMPTKTIPGGHPSKDVHFGVPADELVEKAKIDDWRHGKTGRIREGLPLTTAQRGKISDRQRRQYVRADRRGDPSRMGWDAPANSWQSDNVDPLTIPVPNRPIGNNTRQRRIKPNLPKGHDRSHPDYIGTNVEKARQEEIASPEERVRVRNRRVSDHYVPGATAMETVEFRRRLQGNWRGRGKYVGPDGHAVSPTSGYYGRDQFDGYSRIGERTVTGPKPGQLPKGKVSGTYPEEADVVKAKIDEARHGKTGRLTTATVPESNAITNKRVDRWRRRDDRRQWFEGGLDPMRGRSTFRNDLMSPTETQRQRLRHSRAAKPTGKLPKGKVSGTYPDEPQDVLKSALERLEKKRKPNPKADAESEKIKINREKPENKVRHAFKAAEWTHPNGHPRCLRCGQEECISGYCFDTKGNIDRAMSEYRSDMEKARVDEGLTNEEKVAQRERRHYRLNRGYPDISPAPGRTAQDPLREREFVPGGNLRQWSRWRRREIARTKPKLPKGHDRSNPGYSGTNAAD